MTTVLADLNIEGQAHLLFGALQVLGWTDLLDLRLATFGEVGLTATVSDRVVWRKAQELGMLLLTDNRNKSGEDSPSCGAEAPPFRAGVSAVLPFCGRLPVCSGTPAR